MIELVLLDYLKTKFDIPVVMEEINEDEYIKIQKTGSSINERIPSSSFAIQCYSTSLYNAALLNEELKKVLLGDGGDYMGIAELKEVNKCSLNSDYEYTDTTTKKYRYQATFDLNHY